ncbi:MAG TPA: DnaJ domain-containing protein [Marmoricola sp.]|nr:DnaJ domain-containing protein [Marmoricola sp.]
MSEPVPTARDPFAVLGVPRGATVEELRAAYRSRARRLHPDRHVQGDGTVPAAVHEAFCDLTAAYDRAVVTARRRAPAPPTPAPPQRPPVGVVPGQRLPAATGPKPHRAGPRHSDPLLALLTTPQRSRGQWSPEALEVWALTLVPAARPHLADARRHAVLAGAADLRRLTAATAHALLTLTLSRSLRGATGRRLDALDQHLAAAYDALERELPPAIVERLPARRAKAVRARRGWGAILAR